MAVVYAVKNGSWSDTSTWNTGQLPQPGDTVCANGYTVNIDQDVDLWVDNQRAGIITTRAYSPAVAGGSFTCSRNNTTIRCLRIESGSPVDGVAALQYTAANGTIVADIVGGTANRTAATPCVQFSGSGTLDVYGSAAGGANWCIGVNNASTGTVQITGNVTGGGSTAYGVNNASTGTVQITGNVTGGSGGNAYGVNNASTGTVQITGNVTGGYGSNAYGVNNASSGTVNITGTAHYGKAAPAIYSTANGTLRIVGDLYADPAPAIVWTGSGAYCAIDGNEFGGVSGAAQGNVAACVYKRAQPKTKNRFIRVAEADDTLSGYSGQAGFFYGALYPTLNHPSESDVRYGVTYGPNNELTGTCHVPPPQSVLYGVPVDNTTGIATISAEDIFNAVWNFSQIDSSLTARQLLALIAAVLAGKVDVNENVVTFYAPGSSTTQRLVATVDSQGNRLQITLYPPE